MSEGFSIKIAQRMTFTCVPRRRLLSQGGPHSLSKTVCEGIPSVVGLLRKPLVQSECPHIRFLMDPFG